MAGPVGCVAALLPASIGRFVFAALRSRYVLGQLSISAYEFMVENKEYLLIHITARGSEQIV